jgi:hypothetical protein
MAVWVLYADALELHGLQDLVDHVEFDSFIWDHVLEWVVEKGAIMKRRSRVLTPKDVDARTHLLLITHVLLILVTHVHLLILVVLESALFESEIVKSAQLIVERSRCWQLKASLGLERPGLKSMYTSSLVRL